MQVNSSARADIDPPGVANQIDSQDMDKSFGLMKDISETFAEAEKELDLKELVTQVCVTFVICCLVEVLSSVNERRQELPDNFYMPMFISVSSLPL